MKGKEYDINNNKIIFEGDYLNNIQMQGNFKEYYYNGILKSEGTIIFGKKTGGIKEYNIGGIFMKVNI